MANALKRIATLERALEQLLARAKYYILVRADDTPEEAMKWHVEQGKLDINQQEPVFIHGKIPGKARPMQYKAADLPEVGKPTIAQELAREIQLPKPEPIDSSAPTPRQDKGAALRQQLRIEGYYRPLDKSIH
jgi:hypothetical protein